MTFRLSAVATVVAVVALAGCGAGTGSRDAGAPAAATVTSASAGAAKHQAAASTGAATASRLVTISAVGDTELGDTPNLPPDPRGYLDDVKAKIDGHSQIVFGNLEGTLTTQTSGKCGGHNGGDCFAFRTPPHYARYLAADGFTVLNDANNHSHDFGQAGLDQTIHAIHHAGMKQTGLPGEVTLVKADGIKVAFAAFAPYSNTADLLHLSAAAALIRKARHDAPVVVVYMHAGAEGSDADHVTGHEEFYVGEDRGNPEKFAHMAIRNGASLVIASGPHVVRGMQFYRHHLIAYSLGNFANFHNFGGSGILSDSAILHVRLSAAGAFHSAKLLGVSLDSEGHPTLGGGTVDLVRSLSREDFGNARAHFSTNGTIHPPTP
ncbi:MAG TPA: CapA family protein [Mycobacteriales bacterium]|nr:CapA family protein [Mycobacteriales bacterium]